MKFIEAEPKENVKLYAGIMLLVALSFYAFVLRPSFQQLASYRQEYDSLRREIVTGRAKARELLGYAQRVRGLKSEVLILEGQLREGNQVLLFFKDAEQAAASTRVNLGAITPKETVIENDVARQPIDVELSGRLPDVLRFVRYLEQLPYPLRVGKVDLKTGRTSEAGGDAGVQGLPAGHISAQVEVELYSLPSAKQAAGAPGAAEPVAKKGLAGLVNAARKVGEIQ